MVTIDFKLADIKLEELLGLNAEVREKSVVRFHSYSQVIKLFTFFVKMRLKIYADISNVFILTRKLNNIFLKFHRSLLRTPKCIEIG